MRISIITVTKNNPDGFARTKASIDAQTYRNFEWIVIDGDIEPDNGIYDAMNKGIDRATSDYMIFMNAGDIFADAETLECLVPHLNADFLYGDAMEGRHLKRARHNIAYGMITHHQAMIYKRGALRYDTTYQIAADYKFTAQAMGGTVKYIPLPICIFESGGISQQKTTLGRHEQKQIREELGLKAPFVAVLQALAVHIKKLMPWLYWALRKRLRTSRA